MSGLPAQLHPSSLGTPLTPVPPSTHPLSHRGNKFKNKWDTYDVDEELARLDAEVQAATAAAGGASQQQEGQGRGARGKVTLGRVRTEVGQLNHDLERLMGYLDQVMTRPCVLAWLAYLLGVGVGVGECWGGWFVIVVVGSYAAGDQWIPPSPALDPQAIDGACPSRFVYTRPIHSSIPHVHRLTQNQKHTKPKTGARRRGGEGPAQGHRAGEPRGLRPPRRPDPAAAGVIGRNGSRDAWSQFDVD